MKYVLQTESACVECKAPKQQKEFSIQSEKDDTHKPSYELYIINDCSKCGKYTAKLK